MTFATVWGKVEAMTVGNMNLEIGEASVEIAEHENCTTVRISDDGWPAFSMSFRDTSSLRRFFDAFDQAMQSHCDLCPVNTSGAGVCRDVGCVRAAEMSTADAMTRRDR